MGDCLLSDSLRWTRNTSSNLQGRAALKKEHKTVRENIKLTLTGINQKNVCPTVTAWCQPFGEIQGLGYALSAPGAPWCLTFVLGLLGNRTLDFTSQSIKLTRSFLSAWP